MTTLREKLIKIGAKVSSARYVVFQMAGDLSEVIPGDP
jgi:hypothetical protein